MAYSLHRSPWSEGQVITADMMNHIHDSLVDGIEAKQASEPPAPGLVALAGIAAVASASQKPISRRALLGLWRSIQVNRRTFLGALTAMFGVLGFSRTGEAKAVIRVVAGNALRIERGIHSVPFAVPHVANQMFDVFVADGSVVVAPWINDTTRSVPLTKVTGGFRDRVGREYVGSVRTNAQGFVEDTPTRRFVWSINDARPTPRTWSYSNIRVRRA